MGKVINLPYSLILFGVVFFGFMVVVGVVQARHSKEKAYYISAMMSFLMLLFSASIILDQFIFALALFAVLFIATLIVSVVGLPKLRDAMWRDFANQLKETNFSAPLRIRELLIWKGWFKITSRWGVYKTVCLYSLLNVGGVGAMFFALSIFGVISIAWAIGITMIAGIVPPIFLYRQIRKALKSYSLKHLKRS